jgi:hypothetical protein
MWPGPRQARPRKRVVDDKHSTQVGARLTLSVTSIIALWVRCAHWRPTGAASERCPH